MKNFSKGSRLKYDESIIKNAEIKFNIVIKKEIVDFFKYNNGGYPTTNYIEVNDEKYEIKAFLSLDKTDDYYCLGESIEYFLSNTKGKIIPFAVDSSDNYFCVNNETGKVYYWSSNFNEYYFIVETLTDFINCFC